MAHFNTEFVGLLARMHDGNALAHLREQEELATEERAGWSPHEMLAASSSVIAASLWSLISPKDALKAYRRSAELYLRLKHDYWVVLSLFLRPSEPFTSLIVEDIHRGHLPPQGVAFRMIYLTVQGRDWRGPQRTLESYWRHYGNVPVGRLGIPLGHYLDCARSMSEDRSEGRPETRMRQAFRSAANRFLTRTSDVLTAASHDRFHWTRFQSSVLPAEPEAAAMAAAMARIARTRYQATLMRMLEGERLSEHASVLIKVGDSLVAVDEGSTPHDRLR